MESDSYGIPIELMGGREFGLCDHCKKFQAVGILNDHAWEIAYERYEKCVPEDKKKGRFKQVRRFLPKWYPFRGEDASKNQRRLEFYEKLGKTPPKTQVKRGSMTSSIGYAYSPTASRAGSDFLPVNTRRGIRRPNSSVPSRPRVQTEVAIVDLTLDDDDDAEKTQQEQTNQKTNSHADQNNQEENNEENLNESKSLEKEFFLDEEEELCMKNEISSPQPALRKISNESNISVPSLEDLHPDPPNEFDDLSERNEPASPKDGELIIDEDSTSRKNPSNSPLPNSSEAQLTKPVEHDEMSNSKEDNDKSEVCASKTNDGEKIVVEQEESSPDKSGSEEGNVRSLRAFARRKSILEEAFESIEKDDDVAPSSEPFDLEKIIQETVGSIDEGGKETRETEEAPEESAKVALASDSDSEFKQNFKSRAQIEHDSVDEFSYDEESIKSMGKIEAGKLENFDKPNVQRKEEPALERDSDALIDKKESDCTPEKEEVQKEEKYSQEEFTVELLEGGAHKTEIDNDFEEPVPDTSDFAHITINQDEQDWQNGQAMVREFPIFINQGLANGAAPFKRQRSASIEIESESGEELDVGTRADEIAYYKPLQREEVVVPAQTQENEYIDVMSVKPSMEKPLTVTPELSGSPDVIREGVIMKSVSFHGPESGRKRGVPEDGGVISDDSPERPGSRTSYLRKEKRSAQRQVNNFIQNAFVDKRASTPTLKLVGVTSNGVNFPPASSNTIRHLHPNEYSKVIQPERKRRSPKLQHHPYQRHQVPQTQRIVQRVERIPNTQYFTDPAVQQDLQQQVSRMNERRQGGYHQPGFRSSDHSRQAQEELRLYQQMNQAQFQRAHGQGSIPQQAPRGLVTETVRQTSVMQYGSTPVISQDQLNSVLLQNGQAEQYVHSGQLQSGHPQLQERFQHPQIPQSPFNLFRHPFAVPRFPGAPPSFPFYDPKLISPPGKVFPRQSLPAFRSPHQPASALASTFPEKTPEMEAVPTLNRGPPVPPQFLPRDLNSNSIELQPHTRETFYHPHIASPHNIENKAAPEPALKPISSSTTSQCSATSSSSSSTSSRSQSSTPQFESIVFKNQNECGQHMFSILDTCFPKKLEF